MQVTFHFKHTAIVPPVGRKKKPTSEIREAEYTVELLEFNKDEIPVAFIEVEYAKSIPQPGSPQQETGRRVWRWFNQQLWCNQDVQGYRNGRV